MKGCSGDWAAKFEGFNLPISVTRRKGDKYTLGDLWPSISSKLSKSDLKDISKKVDNLLILRNLSGAHYNEWARSLSRSEAQEFGKSVLDFYNRVFCPQCSNYLSEVRIGTTSDKKWSCRCKSIQIGK